MQQKLDLYDNKRNRKVPVLLYVSGEITEDTPVIIFNPGYQKQRDLEDHNIPTEYERYSYLSEFFTKKGFVFISIQHDIIGDKDGLEFLDVNIPAEQARKHLWIRGEENILFVINELKKKYSKIRFDKFIIAGHSNGGDIAKFFANNHDEKISCVISLDGRRCPIKPGSKQKLLMFEALDTATDNGVLPDEGTRDNPKRQWLEWVIVKPFGAMHGSYRDDLITNELKQYIFRCINFFLEDQV